MRALSIRQPYAEQILRGIKRFEYRSRPTAIRERVYIYAARKPGPAKEFERMRIQPGDLVTGMLVGTVKIMIVAVSPATTGGIWRDHGDCSVSCVQLSIRSQHGSIPFR